MILEIPLRLGEILTKALIPHGSIRLIVPNGDQECFVYLHGIEAHFVCPMGFVALREAIANQHHEAFMYSRFLLEAEGS